MFQMGDPGDKSLAMVVFLSTPIDSDLLLWNVCARVAVLRPLATSGGRRRSNSATDRQTDQALPTVDVNMAT